jgi:hypothetical protein
MTTQPYGDNDPLSTTTSPITTPPASTSADPQHAASTTPIGDGLAHDQGFDDSSDDAGAAASAKETARTALDSASEHGSQVAGTAKEEAADVVAEAKDKATDLLADVRTQADEQSKAQLKNLATKIGELADELDGLVRGSDAGGTVTDAAQQLADRTRQLSSHLDSRQPLDLLDDVRGFARRRPVAFLGGAAVAGVLAGRLTRGAKAAQDTDQPGTTTPAAQSATPVAPSIDVPPTHLGAGLDDVPANQNTGGRQ